jgi:hypothetical protein
VKKGKIMVWLNFFTLCLVIPLLFQVLAERKENKRRHAEIMERLNDLLENKNNVK